MIKAAILTTGCTALALVSGVLFGTSKAAFTTIDIKSCDTQWKALKAAGTSPSGQKWSDFVNICPASIPVATPSPIPAPPTIAAVINKAIVPPLVMPAATAASAVPKPKSAGHFGEQIRVRKCRSEWKTAKAFNTVPAGQTWPQFWSACDTRLKG